MTALGAAELGAAVTSLSARDEGLSGIDHPSSAIPLLALQYLWTYSYVDSVFERQRAAHLRYVPLDTPGELAIAPFDPRVLKHPDVWGAILASLALAVSGGLPSEPFEEDPRLFGRTMSPGVGYPLAAAVGAALFSHVAVAEEAVFRGLIQSQMAREMDPEHAWVGASLAFGAAHAANVSAVPRDSQAAYLALAVPFITVVGGYLGWTYKHHEYSLAPPVAIHFWYDFLVSAAEYLRDPKDSPISARVSLSF
jgi:membrane protease YdiL (CAAX protease family)